MRRATAADLPDVIALTRVAYAPWVPVIGREPLPMQADHGRAIAEHLIDILDDQSGPIALIEMIPRVDHLWLENVAVHPDHQGKGLGRQLIGHAEATARALGLPELRLLTNAAFAANLRFYGALGFIETGRTAFRGGFTAYFARNLVGPGSDNG